MIQKAQEEGIIPVPNESVTMAINALLNFRDQNYSPPSPICSFWKQIEVNGTWRADPSNVGDLFALTGAVPQAFYIP